jgi:hypothetical protein
MTTPEAKIATLQANEINMSKQITKVQVDIEEIKGDIVDLRVSLAKYSGGIIVAISVIQFLINKFI